MEWVDADCRGIVESVILFIVKPKEKHFFRLDNLPVASQLMMSALPIKWSEGRGVDTLRRGTKMNIQE